ncbi:MAG: hypothetical protein KF760_24015 [Candidatus Eremiobacteraeota bacterium]|nr:hypothetical protein [Candidatus Eremiobacteraeota bacterium]MCW5866580.1 hypothetical protein [Candidatus Eremiobacteraeota bacterium]
MKPKYSSVNLGPVSFHSGMPIQPVPLRPLPQAETPLAPGDRATLSTPVPLERPPTLIETPAPPVAKAPAPDVPQTLSLEMGEVGAGLLCAGAPAASYSSSGTFSNNTVGWSGDPAPQAAFGQSHLPQIHGGLQYAEQVMPGFRGKMDELLHSSDPALESKLKSLADEQTSLWTAQSKLLSMPDHKLKPEEVKRKAAVMERLEILEQSQTATEKAIKDRFQANSRKAGEVAEVFLSRLRKNGQVADIGDRLKLDTKASARLAQDGIPENDLKKWVNEFHHQTGLPAPSQLKMSYTEERPNYYAPTDTVNIGDKFSKRMVLHEVAHRAEYKCPEISLANKDWVRARCQKGGFSSEPAKLKELVPNDIYTDGEVALEDTFIDPYVGKVYPDLASEVLSMGLERFSSKAELVKLYTQDPEHFFLTLGAIQIMHSKDRW